MKVEWRLALSPMSGWHALASLARYKVQDTKVPGSASLADHAILCYIIPHEPRLCAIILTERLLVRNSNSSSSSSSSSSRFTDSIRLYNYNREHNTKPISN